MLNQDQLTAFERDGFLIARQVFTRDEVELGERIARADAALKRAGAMKDAQGGESKIWLAMEVKQDIYNAFCHDARLLGPAEQVPEGPVYLWHYKMIMKEPRVGGAWEWHQDYGYWYGDGCLYPRLLSAMIGVNQATRENGCLQVLRGSHRIGRINHGETGQQQGAEEKRVKFAMAQLELVHVELEPGDVLYFHCNLLHSSAQNRSEHPRWAFIACYNSMHNIPDGTGHGQPVRAAAWEDGSIMKIGRQRLARMESTLAGVTAAG